MTGGGKGDGYECLLVTQLGITTVVAACSTVLKILASRVSEDH